MKFSYEEPHVWYQFALSLIETGKVCTMYTWAEYVGLLDSSNHLVVKFRYILNMSEDNSQKLQF